MGDLSILGLGSNVVTFIVSLSVVLAVMKYRIDRLEKQFEDEKEEEKEALEKEFHLVAEIDREQWVAITRVRDWQAVHEKDSATARLDLEKDLGKLRENASMKDVKIDTLITMVAELAKKLDKIEERLEGA